MAAPLTILCSFPTPSATSVNPYTVMLAEHIRRAGLRVEYFSFAAALFGRYNVFHVHWPENLVGGRNPLRRFVRQALTVLILARLAVTRRALVRTMHNLELPEGLSRAQLAVLRLIDRRTDFVIRLNEFTPVPTGMEFATIAHPHYRDWFVGFERSEPIEGQVGFVGRIRRYKGVESLIDAVAMVPRERALTARIAGYPSTSHLARSIVELADDDPRISLEFGFVSDETLVDLITSSELVVLPYRLMHNSGAALVALSLDRPVLVPRNSVTLALGLEVGEGWVHTYGGELHADDITAALESAREPRSAHPRLGHRSWERATRLHISAYARAVRRARSKGAK